MDEYLKTKKLKNSPNSLYPLIPAIVFPSAPFPIRLGVPSLHNSWRDMNNAKSTALNRIIWKVINDYFHRSFRDCRVDQSIFFKYIEYWQVEFSINSNITIFFRFIHTNQGKIRKISCNFKRFVPFNFICQQRSFRNFKKIYIARSKISFFTR